MGQTRPAIAYGIVVTEKQNDAIRNKLQDDIGDWPDLGNDYPNAGCGMTNIYDVLGFVVAVECDADESPGAVALDPWPAIPVGDVKAVQKIIGAKALNAAARKWATFATAAKKHGLKIGAPSLFVTIVETA